MTTAAKPFKRFSQDTIDAVRNVPILDLAEAMGDSPRRVGKQFQVCCPNSQHVERTPDTYIEPNKNIFKCFGGGGCGAKGSSAIQYYGWKEFGEDDTKNFIKCVKGIAELMGIPIMYEDGTAAAPSNKPKKMYTPRPRMEEVPAKDPITCDIVYRAFLSLCPIRENHYQEWLKRGYSNEKIQLMGFRSVPTKKELWVIIDKLIQKGYPLEYIPGFFQRCISIMGQERWTWDIAAGNGYFIPVRDEIGRWVRMRVRRDEGKPKYIWFSSYDNTQTEEKISDIRKFGAASGAPLNITVPTPLLKSWDKGTNITDLMEPSTVITTEGEHKSQLSANKLMSLIIGVPGVGNFKEVIPLLKKWGTKKFILAYDMDALKSVESSGGNNKQVFDHIVDFAVQVSELSISTYLWTWNVQMGKGLDDLLYKSKALPLEVNLTSKQRRQVTLDNIREIW